LEIIPVVVVVRSIVLVAISYMFARGTAKRNRHKSHSRYIHGVYYYREKRDGERQKRQRRELLAYERWLSTPVIKYGASEGSQHACASAFKDGARTFPM